MGVAQQVPGQFLPITSLQCSSDCQPAIHLDAITQRDSNAFRCGQCEKCMLMYVHVCAHECACVLWGIYASVCLYVCINVYTYMCVYVCTCLHMCVCTGVYMQVMLYVYMFVCHRPQTLKNELSETIAPFYYHNPRMAAIDERPFICLLSEKNWLESIVLKQKSIAFGSCPRKFNELIFKAPLCLELNSVAPRALHTDLQVGRRTAPASAFLEFLSAPREGPERFMRQPSRLESAHHSTDLLALRGANGHSTGFQGEEKLIPLLSVRGQSPYWIS